ncbi:MAG: NUDIX domain-containing protein [Gemmatimonadota bacterium]
MAPRPAATVVLVRDRADGPEVLLLRRTRSSGFVPGAWVFPGGRVDAGDAVPDLLARLDGLDGAEAARRLGLEPEGTPGPAAVAYYLAALREAFEETGILVGHRAGEPVPPAQVDPDVEALRNALLGDELDFAGVLGHLDARLDGGRVAYLAHWITPIQEPRRYDTRFFLAEVHAEAESVVDPREMTEARWLRPAAALELNRAGHLPMVFPTIHTLETLAPFASAADAHAALDRREIPTILPRLVRTPTGVGLRLPQEE